MQTSIQMIIEEVKRLSNAYENRVPSVLLFETLFKAEEMHKQEIIDAWHNGYNNQSPMIDEENCGEQYYQDIFKKD
jgi:hypothetical protein